MTEWVPRSCTLPTEERPLRAAEFDALFAERLTAAARPHPLRLQLVLAAGPGVEARVRDLVTRESSCCSFFTFTVTADSDRVLMDVEVDGAHDAVLAALHTRATAAAAGAGRPL